MPSTMLISSLTKKTTTTMGRISARHANFIPLTSLLLQQTVRSNATISIDDSGGGEKNQLPETSKKSASSSVFDSWAIGMQVAKTNISTLDDNPVEWNKKSSFAIDLLKELNLRSHPLEKMSRLPSSSSSSPQTTDSMTLKDICTDICSIYLSHPPIENNNNNSFRKQMMDFLLYDCSTDHKLVTDAVDNYINQTTLPLQEYTSKRDYSLERLTRTQTLTQRLRTSCEPRYESMFTTILAQCKKPNVAMTFLVRFRRDVRTCIRTLEKQQQQHQLQRQQQMEEGKLDAESSILEEQESMEMAIEVARLKQIDEDIKKILTPWFSSAMLELRRITFENTPASIIETVVSKEAVHPYQDFNEVKVRLGSNRRCFALFHPSLPNEPLVFIHAALLQSIPESMDEIHTIKNDDDHAEDDPKTAAFYSITAAEGGLSGIDLGSFLIRKSVDALRQEFPTLETFATLSPIPRFRSWLEGKISRKLQSTQTQENIKNATPITACAGDDIFADPSVLTTSERKALLIALDCSSIHTVEQTLSQLLSNTAWYQQSPMLVQTLRPIILRLGARYLIEEKRRGGPLDSVARFHINNGAEMFRLNYLADTSKKGMMNSAGLMINYEYRLDVLDRNAALYQATGRIPATESVLQWLDSSE